MTSHPGIKDTSSRLGILMADRDNTFWTDMESHYKKIAPEMRLELHFQWPQKEPGAQLNDLLDLIEQDFDALIINPMNRTNLIPGILAASQKNIPVLDVGAKTDSHLVKDAGDLYVPIATVDFREQGALGAKYLLECILPKGGGKIAIFEGRKDAAQSIGRAAGAEEILKSADNIQVIFKGPADFERSRATQIALELLRDHPDIQGFFCANDLMALGVADAVKIANCGKEVSIVGVDLIPEAWQAIQEGQIQASVAFSRADVAQMVLEYASCAVAKQQLPQCSSVKNLLITRDNESKGGE